MSSEPSGARIWQNVGVESKRCGSCKQVKPLDEFALNRKKGDGRDSMCKPCKKVYNSTYYEATKEHLNPIRAQARKRAVARAQDYVYAYLRAHPCVDCGETDIIVLDFDHQGDKSDNIGTMISNGTALHRLAAEIAKCEVVCANDHRRRTARDFRWRRGTAA